MIDTLSLSDEIRKTIGNFADNSERSKQTAIGMSEIGQPCVRRLGYKMLGVEATNKADTWLATIGTAVHSWLAERYATIMIEGTNEPRYLVEHRVMLPDGTPGTLDIYDKVNKCIQDWKVVGDSTLKKYKATRHPGEQYQVQQHAYGMALQFAELGYEVNDVVIVFLPRGGALRNLYVWSEEFNPNYVVAALERNRMAKIATDAVGIDALELLPAVAAYCDYCPNFLPASTNLKIGCPGENSNPTQSNPTQTEMEIA